MTQNCVIINGFLGKDSQETQTEHHSCNHNKRIPKPHCNPLSDNTALNSSHSTHNSTHWDAVLILTCRSVWLLRPSANWQSSGLTERKVGLPSKGSTQEPLALRKGRCPLGEMAPVSVSSSTESLMWLMIWWFSSRSCSSCSMRFCNTEIWLWKNQGDGGVIYLPPQSTTSHDWPERSRGGDTPRHTGLALADLQHVYSITNKLDFYFIK